GRDSNRVRAKSTSAVARRTSATVAAAAPAVEATAAAWPWLARRTRCDLAFQFGPDQVDLAAVIDGVDLDPDAVAFLEEVADVVDALLGDLAYVQQAIGAGEERDEGAELRDLGDLPVVLLAQFGRRRQRLDPSLDGLGCLRVLGVDADGAVLADLAGSAE